MKKKRDAFESLISDHLRDVVGIIRITDGTIAVVEELFKLWRTNLHIKRDEQVFIPLVELRKHSSRHYATIRNACCVMKHQYNMNQTCKLIIGWDYKFDVLCFKLLNLYVISNNKYIHHSRYLRVITTPGGSTAAYTNGIDSKTGALTSYRWYHKLQNMSKKQRDVLFNGCLDLDIVACFPTLFNKYIFKDSDKTPAAYHIMINQPQLFLKMLIDADVWTYPQRYDKHSTPRDKAKQMRSRLFNYKDEKPLKNVGLHWYDELALFIYKQMMDNGINKGHTYFTELEQRLVQIAIDIIGEDNVHMRMHDGFITTHITHMDILLQKIIEATGIEWKVKVIKSE